MPIFAYPNNFKTLFVLTNHKTNYSIMKKTIFTLIGIFFIIATLGACSKGENTEKREITEADREAYEHAAEKASEGSADKSASAITYLDAEPMTSVFENVNKLTVIDFNAEWCVPCRKFESIFDAAAANFSQDADFYSVDIDGCPELASKYGVESIPTVLIIRPDGKQQRFVGLENIYPYESFDKIIRDNLK